MNFPLYRNGFVIVVVALIALALYGISVVDIGGLNSRSTLEKVISICWTETCKRA